MAEYLEYFIPELFNLISDWSSRLLQVDEVGIIYGLFLAFLIVGAILRIIFH